FVLCFWLCFFFFFFFSSRRRHTRSKRDWSSDVCSSDLKLRIGVVTGDDLLGRLDGLLARGHELRNLDTNRRLADVRDRVVSANAYLGAWPVVDALRRDADVVVTGRVTDTGLTLAPMIHAFGWRPDAWDLLAAGTVAGHTIECGAQIGRAHV